MIRLLLNLRWLALVIAFFSALHAIAFIAVGVIRGMVGYRILLDGPPWSGDHAPGVHLAKSIDAFLLSMVFFVFSIGVTTLFLAKTDSRTFESIPEWMRVRNLAELKFLIWEAILAALVVASVEAFVLGNEITWNALILPAGVLILAIGLFVTRKAH